MFLTLAGVFGFYEVLPDFWIGRLLGFAVLIGIVVAAALGIQILYWLLAIQPLRFRLFSLFAVLIGALYGMALAILLGLLIASLRSLRANQAALSALGAAGGRRRASGDGGTDEA